MRFIPPIAILIFALSATQPSLAQPGCTGAGPIVCTATGESTTAGMVVNGSYIDTTAANGFELIEEQDATAGPPRKRADLLEHTWQFNAANGASFKFAATAYRIDAGGDGDDFAFSYSKDGGQSWNGMFVVASESSAAYEYNIPGNASGALLVRAVDTDRTGGRKNHAGLYVAYLAVIVSNDPPPPPNPEPGVSAKRIIGYYTSWSIYASDYFVNQHEPGVDHIPAGKVTHINYAFANLSPDGTVILGDEFADVNKIFGNEPQTPPIKVISSNSTYSRASTHTSKRSSPSAAGSGPTTSPTCSPTSPPASASARACSVSSSSTASTAPISIGNTRAIRARATTASGPAWTPPISSADCSTAARCSTPRKSSSPWPRHATRASTAKRWTSPR